MVIESHHADQLFDRTVLKFDLEFHVKMFQRLRLLNLPTVGGVGFLNSHGIEFLLY